MKNIITWVIAIVIVLGGTWLLWPKSSVAPTASPTLSAMPSASPSTSPTPVKSVLPKKTVTPKPSPTLAPGTAVEPTIDSVTAYQTTTEPSGWWISIKGSFSGVCARPLSPSFSRDGNNFMVVMPAESMVSGTCLNAFTQTILLAHDPLAPGIYNVFVNGTNRTSFIIATPTPTPTPTYTPPSSYY